MTAGTDSNPPGTIMISPDDFALAREYVRGTAHTAKWNKPHFQAAAAGMAWLIRELPGSPRLMCRLLDLLTTGDDRSAAISNATNLIRAQFGLDASVLSTSTQIPGTNELNVSLIPGNQAACGAGASGGSRMVLASNEDDYGDADSFDSTNASGRTTAAAAPAAAPAPAAVGDGGPGEGGPGAAVVAAAAATAAATAAAGAAVDKGAASSKNRNPHVHKTLHKPHVHKTTSSNKTPVCSYLWKRMLCRRTDCRSLHPELCSNPTCAPRRDPTCTKFHGHFRVENSSSGTNGVGPKPKPKVRHDQGNGRGGVFPPNRHGGNNNRSNNRSSASRPTHSGGGVDGRRGGVRNNNSSIRQDLDKSIRDLALARRELAALKRTHPNSSGTAAAHVSFAPAQPSGHAQQLSSFATTFAAVLETALSASGLRLASV